MPSASRSGRTTCLALALFALATGGLTACHSNAHGYQDLPHVVRIESRPSGAELMLKKANMFFTLPSDIEMDLDGGDEIIVRKPGYHSYRGPVGALPRSARNTLTVVLRPIEPSNER